MINSLLFLMVAMPVLGAFLVLLFSHWGVHMVRQLTLTNALITLGLAVVMVANYHPQTSTEANAKAGQESYAGDTQGLIQMRTDVGWLRDSLGGSSGAAAGGTAPDIRLALAVDGLSLWLVALSALLVVPAILVSWDAVQDRPATFYALLLLLEAGMIGVFAAQDIILFYIFFEFTLIPLFFMIGIWGGHERRWAARKFFIYTFAGSALTFLGLLFIVLSHYWMRGMEGAELVHIREIPKVTFVIPELVADIQMLVQAEAPRDFWHAVSPWVFLALFAGFAIKVPLFPFHTWLPLAHVEAPTAGSVLLAGVLLKIGSYGFLRFALPLVPYGCWWAFDYVAWLSVIGIIYGALVALAQDDIKRLVAYSSVSHMGFCMLGLFSLNSVGISGGLLQMINHGLSTGALFAIVGMLYERYHTRDIEAYSGMARKFPVLTFCLLVVTFSSIGLPGLNGFTGELLSLMGMFHENQFYAMLGLTGIVIGAWYMLGLVQRTFFGRFREPLVAGHGSHATPGHAAPGHASGGHASGGHAVPNPSHEDHSLTGHGSHAAQGTPGNASIGDLNFREIAALAPLMGLMLWIGVYPQYFLDRMLPSIRNVTEVVQLPENRASRAPSVATRPTSVEKVAVELRRDEP